MQNLDLILKPSREFILLTFLILLGNLSILYLVDLALWIKIIFYFAVILYVLVILATHGCLITSSSIISLSSLSNGLWELNQQGNFIQGYLLNDSTVTWLVCVLRFQEKDHGFKVSCLIWRDSLSGDFYRQLQVRLRCLSLNTQNFNESISR